ncbi:MAG: N-succinylarginine dihydrolase, partial [Aureliella sp.]
KTGKIGINIFVYGDDSELDTCDLKYLPRQTRAACDAIARRHQLDPQRTFFLQQHPDAISAGVFHNDVISTSHGSLLIHHELAFCDEEQQLQRLDENFLQATGARLVRIEIPACELPLDEAIRSYFFNSQMITPHAPTKSGHTPQIVLISPQQCSEIASTRRLIERLIASSDNPIEQVHYVSLEQSMAGGGGPACLRLRVPLAHDDIDKLPRQPRLDRQLEDRLAAAIERWYPETLDLTDLCDLAFATELSQINAHLQNLFC